MLGGPFLVVEWVDGVDITNPSAAAQCGPVHELGISVIDTLVELHGVDLEAAALTQLHRPNDWPLEQIGRWSQLLDSYESTGHDARAGLPGIDVLFARLRTNRPITWELGLLHGDMHLGNVLIDPATGTVRAIVDWELASLGDP